MAIAVNTPLRRVLPRRLLSLPGKAERNARYTGWKNVQPTPSHTERRISRRSCEASCGGEGGLKDESVVL